MNKKKHVFPKLGFKKKKVLGVNCISHEAKVVKDRKLNGRPVTHIWL